MSKAVRWYILFVVAMVLCLIAIFGLSVTVLMSVRGWLGEAIVAVLVTAASALAALFLLRYLVREMRSNRRNGMRSH